jgi:hypothetical protein
MTSKQVENNLKIRGFDSSVGRHVKCSQCQAMVINGHACHETGCPNATHECSGCNAIISKDTKYCQDCI